MFASKSLSVRSVTADDVDDDPLGLGIAIFGLPGMGKSELLRCLALEVIALRLLERPGELRRSVVVFDVNTDLYFNLRADLALRAEKYPLLNDLLVVIDPTPRWGEWTIKYNPLELLGRDPELRARALTDTVLSVFADDRTITTQLYRVLKHAFKTLALSGRTLVDFSQLLTDSRFREKVLLCPACMSDRELMRYWQTEFPKDHRLAIETARSSLNRVGEFASHPYIARIIDSPKSTINFRNLMDQGKIVLINLSNSVDKLGKDGAYLLGAFLLAEFHAAAMSREDIPRHTRRPFLLVCDEWLSYGTSSALDILQQARKMNVSIVAATQTIEGERRYQDLLHKLLALAGTVITFGISRGDAEVIAPYQFTHNPYEVKQQRKRWQRRPLVNLGFIQFGHIDEEVVEEDYLRIDESNELAVSQLMKTSRQYVWVKRGQEEAFRMRVPDMVSSFTSPDAYRLPAMLKDQDEVACKLCGVSFAKPVPLDVEESQKEPDVKEDKEKTQPITPVSAYISLWSPWPGERIPN